MGGWISAADGTSGRAHSGTGHPRWWQAQADESTLYHHFELNYTPISTQSGRRLARR
jgi:hypothetical protein